jgi:folate-binding protein YgfZ
MVPEHFGNSQQEYEALASGVGLHDRSYRGVIELTGNDRANWLHNLTTNHVAGVPVGQARYLFACNVKGRILFDANALILPDAIWLDLDHRYVAAALDHLDKYLIAEDVTLSDGSDSFYRLALTGNGRHRLLTAGGLEPNLSVCQAAYGGTSTWMLRHDFCGLPGVELFVPAGREAAVWAALQQDGAIPVGIEAIEMRRIEAGIPWSGEDLDEEVLPAETGRLQRAVSFDKGCYLGQEVVERMRAHEVVARRLVGLKAEGSDPFAKAAALYLGQTVVGRVTSTCISPARGAPIGLGYVRTAQAEPDTRLLARWEAGETAVRVTALPFVG